MVGVRFQATKMPAVAQIALVSSSTWVTSDGEMSGATVTSALIDETNGRAASADAESSAAVARLVAISIFRGIDGCHRQKFDVRSRNERTPCGAHCSELKIDRDDMFAEARAELSHRHVPGIFLISVQGRPVAKRDHQAGIVGSG